MKSSKGFPQLQVIYRDIDTLLPHARNARTHSETQIDQVVSSIKEFGWTNPILLDGKNGVIAGHCRLEAARKLNMKQVPCIDLIGLSEAQKKAYILADNKLAINAGWNDDLLKLEFEDLKNLDFNLELTGFDPAELQEMLEGNRDASPQLDDIGFVDGKDEKASISMTFRETDKPSLIAELKILKGKYAGLNYYL